ncbi:MAG: glycine cleavage system H protein [Planctomycetaceae bacterium]|nr:MAG: glycine cleavage system H protein [Planctomycetaceae bacterium]
MSATKRYYTKTHEWLTLEGDVATVGITQFAVNLLSDVVNIELPSVGQDIRQAEPFGEIESVKHVSDLYAPASGTVTEVNASLANNLEWLSQDPFGRGWMIRLRLSQPQELQQLLDEAAYQAHCEAEQHG